MRDATAPARRLLGRLVALDQAAYDCVARRPAPLLDRVLPPLSRSADHGGLWALVTALLWASGRPELRAAGRQGALALCVASPVANVLGKGLVRRVRPTRVGVPTSRLLPRQPLSSSFPSGHSASAAAFAAGVGLQSAPAALPVALLGAAVAYSRVHVGVHYPGDVVAGAALGVAVAAATARVWGPSEPAR